MTKQPLYVRIKALRTSRGLTDIEFASRLGVDIDTYRLYESGTQEIPYFTIVRASRVLNYPALTAELDRRRKSR